MKAIEFTKEWGCEYSKKYVALAESEGNILPWELELKRLVESLDRVTKLGGISKAKDHLDYLISYGSEFAGVSKQEIDELQQDLAIYKSIYGVSHA